MKFRKIRKIAVAAAAVFGFIALYKAGKRRRSLWSRQWLLRRSTGRDLAHLVLHELRYEDVKAFQNFVRMSVSSFDKLVVKVRPYIAKQDTILREAIPAETRLLVTLRFLATGETYHNLSYGFRISVPALSQIIPETLEAIYAVLKDDYMKMPQTKEEWVKIANDFHKKWNFPFCLGALDGKHIAIEAKKEYGSYFYNYKCFHSVILLALVDANYRFIYVYVGANGRANDAAVFHESSLCKGIEMNLFDFPEDEAIPGIEGKLPYVMVGDDAFRLGRRIMKPFGQRSTIEQKIFNYRLSRARRVSENAFGLLSNKFQIFQKEINLPLDKVEQVVMAACALHNYIRDEDGFDSASVDNENIQTISITPGSWRQKTFITKLEKIKSKPFVRCRS
nr:putative nuclease HARBI1 isoform X1 [Aedes albopictus]